jgi:O-antigen/teichoic acid export membrane protein
MSETVSVESQPQQGLGQTVFKNTAFITLGNVTLKVLSFLFSVYIVRALGDDRFGQYSIVLAFVGLFSIFAELGMTQYAMREIAQDRSKTQSLLWNLVVLRLLLAGLGIVGITLGAVVVGYSSELVLGIFIQTCSFLLSAFAVPLQVILTANERFDYVSGLNILGQFVFVAFGSIFLLNGWGFISLIIASLIGIPLQITLAAWAIKRHRLATFSFQIDPHTWIPLIRAGIPFGIISLALMITFSVDSVMLSIYQPEHVVGWYNVAYRLVFALMFFFSGFKEAIVPSLSRTYISDPARVERWYYRSVKIILLLSFPMAIGGTLVAFPLTRFLYTDKFLPSAPALQILIWDVPFLMFSAFCGNMATIVSEERAAARIYSVNAVANIALNLYAISNFGMIGASFITVVTDLIGSLQFYLLFSRKLHLPNMTTTFVRVAIASVVMGAAVWLAGDRHLFVLIGVGTVVYVAMVLVLRLFDDTEKEMLSRLVRRGRHPETVTESI